MNLWRQIRDHDLNGNGDKTDEIPLALEQGKTGERCMAALLNAFGIKCNYECTVCVLDDGTYTLVTQHPKYKDFLKAVNQLYKEGLIDNNYSTRYQQELFDAMDNDLVGTTFTWAERCSISTQTIRENGNKDALWEAVAPMKGPYGDQILPARHMVNSIWCITATAKENGKLEDILRFFDWCFSKEGYYLYNYGIEGVSYDMVDGKPILKEEMVKNGFTDYRNYGCQFEPFGGYYQEDTFMQCLFKGKNIDELDDASAQFYKGLSQVNDGFYYNQVKPLETDSYVKDHTSLITDKLCKLRDQAITGEISLKDFWKSYEKLKENGLQKIIDEGNKAYKKVAAS